MSFTQTLNGKHFVLGLCGGIAAYKSAQLCRALIKAGATVQVVMTESATQFITALTMQALSGREVFVSQWDAREAAGISNNMVHINLTRAADAVLVAPASADFMARLLHGRADDLLSLMCLARPAALPLILAPAMNNQMWAHPATQRNVAQLKRDGAHVLGVGTGEQACGEEGDGRMLESDEILDEIVSHFTPKVFCGKKVLITAGPTFEAIDPVRGITNRSSGKMGFAIARAAQHAGAQVTLVAGPVSLPDPPHVRRIDVQSARHMHEAVLAHAPDSQVFIATAAVADWRVQTACAQKIKKNRTGQTPAFTLVENPDILASVASSPAAQSGQLFCVGFAAESENLVEHAKVKRARKGVPLLVGNIGPLAFGQDDNELVLIDAHRVVELPRASKAQLAQQLVREIAQRSASQG